MSIILRFLIFQWKVFAHVNVRKFVRFLISALEVKLWIIFYYNFVLLISLTMFNLKIMSNLILFWYEYVSSLRQSRKRRNTLQICGVYFSRRKIFRLISHVPNTIKNNFRTFNKTLFFISFAIKFTNLSLVVSFDLILHNQDSKW